MITIRSEKDLHELISQVADRRWDYSREIRFDGYPRFEITLRGERFNGGVPTRIMPVLLELQRTIDRTAAEIMGVRRLDQETKRRLEIVVQVEDGSTSFFPIWVLFSIHWLAI